MATFSASDQSALEQMFQGASNIPWATLLGYANPGVQPPPNSATLGAEEAAGYFTNPPFAGNGTLAGDQTFGTAIGGPFNGQQTVAQEGLSGQLNNGQQTLGQETLSGVLNNGQLTAANQQATGFVGNTANAGGYGPSTQLPGQNVTSTAGGQSSTTAEQGITGRIGSTSETNVIQQYLADHPNQGYAQYIATYGMPQTLDQLVGPENAAAYRSSLANGPTLAARGQAGSFLQNAAAGGFANPFTAQAKLQGLQNAGALGGLLGNNLASASGTSMANLRATPNLTNVQLGTDLANAQVGKPVSALTQNFLSQMLGVPQQASGGATPTTPQLGSGAGGVEPGQLRQSLGENGQPIGALIDSTINPADGGTTVIGGTHYHLPNNPLTAENPGSATPLQEFDKLDPSSQSAFIDLQANQPNGQTSTDFLSQMKRAAPSSSFRPASFATSGI